MQEVQQHLYEYGVLGIICFAFGFLLWQQWTRAHKKNEELERRVDSLQEQLRRYLDDERTEMLQVIRDNTQAFTELRQTIHQMISVAPRATRKLKDNVK
jgi:DNA anti-recombination protein RmuC